MFIAGYKVFYEADFISILSKELNRTNGTNILHVLGIDTTFKIEFHHSDFYELKHVMANQEIRMHFLD